MVVFDHGFRPFFFLAGAWSAIAVALWLAMLAGRLESPSALDPVSWHVHEMVFGFAAAAIGGFILTAIPNWTGRAPVAGAKLAGLVAAWLAGRIAMFWSAAIGAEAAAILDLAYLVALCAVAAREITAGGNRRNLPIAGVIGLLAACNLLVHLEQLGVAETAAMGNRLGIAVIVLLVTVIGGRITPAFTRNWLRARDDIAHDDTGPREAGWPDRAAIAATALAGLSWGIAPDWTGTGAVAILAAVGHAIRLAGWRGHRTLAEPLLSVLHLGALWLVVGFALLGASVFVDGLEQTGALHALTAGAVGTMVLAVMTRASLGHTGRDLKAGAGTKAVFALVTLAALARVVAGAEETMLVLSGALWIGAFALFTVLYAPILLLPAPEAGAK